MDERRDTDRRETQGAGDRIKVEFFATLRLVLGVAGLEIEAGGPVSVRQLIDMVSRKLGTDISVKLLDGDRVKRGTMILVNGKNIHHLNGLDTTVNPGDRVAVFPPAGGG